MDAEPQVFQALIVASEKTGRPSRDAKQGKPQMNKSANTFQFIGARMVGILHRVISLKPMKCSEKKPVKPLEDQRLFNG